MNLLKFIWRTCRGMMLVTTATAALSGACTAALIALVNVAFYLRGRYFADGTAPAMETVAIPTGK